MKKRERSGKRSKVGAPKVIPEGWNRMGYFTHPWVGYAIGALAHAEGVHPSVLVNRVLLEYALKRRASVPKSGKGLEPPTRSSLP